MQLKLLFTLLLSIVTFIGCANIDQKDVGIILEEGPQGWIVAYKLPVATNGILFPSSESLARQQTWTLIDGSQPIENINGFDVVVSDEAETEFRFVIQPDFKPARHNYSPFIDLGEGNQAVFTGQFEVLPLRSREQAGELRPDLSNYNGEQFNLPLVISFDGLIHVDGETASSVVKLREWRRGKYVFLGDLPTLNIEGWLGYFDLSMPGHIKTPVEDSLREILRYQARHWGGDADGANSTVFVTFGGYRGEGLYLKGGALGQNTVTLDFRGSALRVIDDHTRLFIRQLIAHELTHIFQQRLRSEASETDLESWFVEGHAEATALYILNELKYATPDEVRTLQRRALERCAAMLERGPLQTAHQRGDRRADYECGHIIWLLMMKEKGNDPISLWRGLNDLSERNALSRLSDGTRDAVRQILSSDIVDPLDFLSIYLPNLIGDAL